MNQYQLYANSLIHGVGARAQPSQEMSNTYVLARLLAQLQDAGLVESMGEPTPIKELIAQIDLISPWCAQQLRQLHQV